MGKYIYRARFKEFNRGKVLYDYLVSIDLEPISIGRLPTVKELEDKIPNNLENHKYIYNNSFCFGIGLHERIIYRKMMADFGWFIEKQIKGFLSAAAHMDMFGVWGAEEFSHDELKARQESITRLTGFYNFTKSGIDLFEKNILTNEGYCYCGSNKQFRDCHLKMFNEDSESIVRNDILKEISLIRSLIKGF